jgi:hypothetical protein
VTKVSVTSVGNEHDSVGLIDQKLATMPQLDLTRHTDHVNAQFPAAEFSPYEFEPIEIEGPSFGLCRRSEPPSPSHSLR